MMKAVAEAGLVPDLDMFVAAAEACSSAGDDVGALHFYDQADKLVQSQLGSNAHELGPSQSREKVGDETNNSRMMMMMMMMEVVQVERRSVTFLESGGTALSAASVLRAKTIEVETRRPFTGILPPLGVPRGGTQQPRGSEGRK